MQAAARVRRIHDHVRGADAVIGRRYAAGDPALTATANWRAIAEEIWTFAHGPASTPMGEAEAAWRARHQASAA